MSLLSSEVADIKRHLGFNLLGVGATAYVGIAQIFEQVIQPYLLAGASTTCTQTIAAASPAAPITLTLASASGVSPMARLIVDVDDRQEAATVQSVDGAEVTLMLSKAHAGTFPVTVEGGESIVRDVLSKLRTIDRALIDASGDAGIKKVDEIEFFGDGRSRTSFEVLQEQQRYWRSELCRALFGVGDLRQVGGGAVRLEVF